MDHAQLQENLSKRLREINSTLTMKPKQCLFHDAAPDKVWRGIEKLAEAVPEF